LFHHRRVEATAASGGWGAALVAVAVAVPLSVDGVARETV
jgi:hypothetical protein